MKLKRRFREGVLVLAMSLCALSVGAWASTISDANFSETQIASGLTQATCMAWAPDNSNRLFVTLRSGPIRIIKNGVLLSTPFATLSPNLNYSEMGVLSICFDPNFSANKYIYVFYSKSTSEQQIVRFADANNDDIADGAAVVIKDSLPTVGANHDGGGCTIGPDGKIYWAVGNLGNGTSAGEGADLASLASKVGRANLDGSPVNDNPYFNDADGIGPTDYIWARGFRNPFSQTWQVSTGKLWVNVVGDSYEQIFQVNKNDHVGDNDRENSQTSPYIPPRIVYRTNGTDSRTIASSGAVRNNNVVTFTTTAAHGFRIGAKITVSGVTDVSFNGSLYVASVPSTITFTAAQVGPNATSSGGTATTQALGGCVTGGCFYEATLYPSAYQGNFFWGDYNSGNIMRATLDGSNNIASVDIFATGAGNMIDLNVGPDGALYYLNYGSSVYRLNYVTAQAQGLVVAPAFVSVVEGGSVPFGVRLTTAPAANVTVNIARSAGDTDISASPPTLTFTPANWSTPQFVTVSAAEDADTTVDLATISVSSSGLTTRDVAVRSIDNDEGLVLSANTLNINEGGNGSFTVRLSSAPTNSVTVNIARTSGDTDISPSQATLTFTPANYATAQTVTVSAAEDADLTNDSATISVSGTGLTTRTVSVTATDNDASAPTITSSAVTTAVVGIAYTYDVDATGNPAPTFSLTTFPSGMSINSSSGVIDWTPGSTGSFNVTVKASNGVAPDATQSFSITVNPDQPPTASLTRPTEGEIVMGKTAEFYGDGADDGGTVKAEFYVDGVLKYTDNAAGHHYHYGGGHNLWDTTGLRDGIHTVKMTVYDAKNQSGSVQRNVVVKNGAGVRSTDFNGDRKHDVLLRHPSNGNVYLWLMQ